MVSRILLVLSIVYVVASQEGPPTHLYKPVSYKNTQYNGIVRGPCSGSFIKSWTGSEPPANAPAYVLSAGHCFGNFLGGDKGKLLFDYKDASTVTTNDFSDRDESPTPITMETFPINKVNFATMNLTDIAVAELTVTARELLSKGYNFYPVSDTRPQGNLLEIGFPSGSRMISADTSIQESVSYLEAWGHEIEMGYFYIGAAYPGFSGSSHLTSSNVVNCVTSQMSNTESGYCQRVDYINPCFSNGVFDFSIPACFADYKKRMFERFALVLPGFSVVDNSTGGTAKFGDQSQVVVPGIVKTETSETDANGAARGAGSAGTFALIGTALAVFAGILA